MTIQARDFEALATTEGESLLSIYMPTHEAGPDIRQDPIRLKNLLGRVETLLAERGCDAKRAASRLKPVRALIDDADFWRTMGRGLALFVSDAGLEVRRLSGPVDELAAVSDRFVVRPLLPELASGETFWLLVLSEKRTRLARCTEAGAREVEADALPSSLAEVVGRDVEQKSLQYHAAPEPVRGGRGGQIFHGQGSGGGEDELKELEQYLRAVDNGVREILPGAEAALVLGGEERIVSMFREVTHHRNVLEGSVAGNHDHLDLDRIWEEALPLAEPALDAGDLDRLRRLRESAHAAVTDLRDVLPKARHARVDTLFLDPRRPVWGRFDESAGEAADAVEIHDERESEDDDLLDLAVVHALRTGARIVSAEPAQMPGETPVAALLRY